MYTACILHVYYMYTTCILHVYYMYTTCSIHVYYMYTTCILHVYYMYMYNVHTCNATTLINLIILRTHFANENVLIAGDQINNFNFIRTNHNRILNTGKHLIHVHVYIYMHNECHTVYICYETNI